MKQACLNLFGIGFINHFCIFCVPVSKAIQLPCGPAPPPCLGLFPHKFAVAPSYPTSGGRVPTQVRSWKNDGKSYRKNNQNHPKIDDESSEIHLKLRSGGVLEALGRGLGPILAPKGAPRTNNRQKVTSSTPPGTILEAQIDTFPMF